MRASTDISARKHIASTQIYQQTKSKALMHYFFPKVLGNMSITAGTDNLPSANHGVADSTLILSVKSSLLSTIRRARKPFTKCQHGPRQTKMAPSRQHDGDSVFAKYPSRRLAKAQDLQL